MSVPKYIRKTVIFVVGITLLLIGVLLLILPGPGIVVIIAGLFVLSIEFAWAERHLQRAKAMAQKAKNKVRS